jgi:uncharacterized protein
MFRNGLKALALFALIVIALAAIGYHNAVAPPVERHLNIEVGASSGLQRPLRLVLFSDVHVHGPDMPPRRLEAIVSQINRDKPDIVIAAGDFVGDNWIGAHYPIDDAVAPLAGLRSRLGTFAVLGNNDHIAGKRDMVEALRSVGVQLLNNRAVKAGPIDLGGSDYRLDKPPSKAIRAVYATLASMQTLDGIQVLVAHSPDVFPAVPSSVSLVLAGHTHCGQIAFPVLGPLLTGSRYGRQFVCGVYRRKQSLLVVTAGLGTSHVPIRFGAHPDFWVIDIHR